MGGYTTILNIMPLTRTVGNPSTKVIK
jgi:hypothetical protein